VIKSRRVKSIGHVA